MKKNTNLHKAKNAKDDEFYTRITDVEKEMKHYKEQLKGKVIFLNCDDHKWSNFYKYFELNFKHLGIKKLIATHYNIETTAYKIEITLNEDKTLNIVQTDIEGNGDFRSPQSVELFKEADIIITNPPFSLFREFIAQLEAYNKKYLIIGSHNSITYKEIFPLLTKNKMWLGYNMVREFIKPNGVVQKFGNVGWYTNLDTTKRHEDVILYERFSKEKYPTYDNYDAINVDKIKDIPEDYFGAMGVPITFMYKYNPSQFEILNCNDIRKPHMKNKEGQYLIKDKDGTINGKNKYARVVIKRKGE